LYGELWLVDEDGNLIDDVAFWIVSESADWAKEEKEAPVVVMSRLSDQRAALVIFNDTDGSSPSAPDTQKEWMLFDNIILTACYDPDAASGMVYMPIIRRP
jgi:hypothetical protein